MYSDRFWQAFLSAGLPSDRAREFLERIPPGVQEPLTLFKSWSKLKPSEREKVARFGNVAWPERTRVLESDEFPENLLQFDGYPPVIFVRGDSACLNRPKIGIVGTRRATTQGKAIAQKFAERLALAGLTVVSGGAFGIDAAAHKGALAVGKPTACVLSCGVDVAQPPAHAQLLKDIADCGCLVSPYALGTKSEAHRLLARNELLARLVDALLVIEAPIPSGSLNTASHAANMGRPLYVVPGSISYEQYRGSHQLIRDGATLVDHPDQILEDLGHSIPLETEASLENFTEEQARILEVLSNEAIPVEMISQRTGIDPGALMGEITMLELEGLIMKHAGGYSRR